VYRFLRDFANAAQSLEKKSPRFRLRHKLLLDQQFILDVYYSQSDPPRLYLYAHPGGFFFWGLYMKPRYAKPPITLSQQSALLIQRGLTGISAIDLEIFLARVSFYRLRGYTFPFQDNSNPRHPFKSQTSWSTIRSHYEFDQKLRLLIMGAIESIEIAFRTQLVLHFSILHGTNWYEQESLFFRSNQQQNDLAVLDKEWLRSRETFAEHYRQNYDTSIRPPAWMIVETCSFGTLSKLFENLQTNLVAKQNLSEFFGCGRRGSVVMSSWRHHLSGVRNICAHHGRLFNRVLMQSPKFLEVPHSPWIEQWPASQRIYATLCIMAYLLTQIHADSSFKEHAKELLSSAHPNQLKSMGVPSSWHTAPLWTEQDVNNAASPPLTH